MDQAKDDAAYYAVTDLYSDWSRRLQTLSAKERIGYLAIDYWIRLEMHAFDGLIQGNWREVVAALNAVNLFAQAAALERAMARATWDAKEEALLAIANANADGDDAIYHRAVFSFMSDET
ncbi:MAG: hypothetical protein AB7O98_15495 [Hyphomonadaceae bacterium]